MTLEDQLNQTISPFTSIFFLFFIWLGTITFKVMAKIMPKTFNILLDYFKKSLIAELKEEVAQLRIDLNAYKERKHDLEGENKTLREGIKEEDPEIRKVILQVIQKQHEKD